MWDKVRVGQMSPELDLFRKFGRAKINDKNTLIK